MLERVDQMHVKDVYRDRKFPFEVYHGSKEGMPRTGPVYQNQHWHEALQFTLVNRGSITMQVNGRDYRLTAGEGLFINYGYLHALTAISDDGEYVSLNVQDKVLGFFPDSRMEERYVLPYITNYALPVTFLRHKVQRLPVKCQRPVQIRYIKIKMVECQHPASPPRQYSTALRSSATASAGFRFFSFTV